MWFKSKKKSILREIARELIGKEVDYDFVANDVTTFCRW